MSSSFFSSISSVFSQLTAAGVTPSAAITDIHTMFGTSSTASAVNGYLVTIVGSYANPAVVQDCVTKIEEISGLPASVSGLVNQLTNAAANAQSNPVVGLAELNALVSAIKTQLSS